MCIRDNTPMMRRGPPGGPPSAAPDILEVGENPMVADLFGVEQVTVGENGALVDSCMTGDINLATRIEQAGTRFTALNSESDDYADDLTELRAEFSGPVMDAIFEESLARRTASKASSDYVKAQTSFINAAEAGVGGEHMAYLALEVTEEEAATDISYTSIDGMVMYLTETDRSGNKKVIGVTIAEPSASATPATQVVTTTTSISTIIDDWKTPAAEDLKNAEAVLSLVTAGDLVLSTAQVEFLQDVVRFREDEIAKYDALITDIEQVEANADTVAEYQTAKVALESQLSTLTSAISNQARKRADVVNALIDPGQHLDQLVALAQSDYDAAVERGLTGRALMPFTTARDDALAAQAAYDSAAGDSDNPAGDLLTALIAQDDTSQALLDAVSGTYGKTVENKTAIEDLVGDDGLVAANTAHLEDHEERITTNEADIETNTAGIATNKTGIATNKTGIATNKAEIVRVEERVDSNWDAIGANQMDIATNRSNINGLRKGLDVATAGVAAAMALAALPDVEGARSFGVGLGTFDGKTAVAVGFSYGTERFTFKVGAATASGETGGSAGIGWSF